MNTDTTEPIRILITGSRDWEDRDLVRAELDKQLDRHGRIVVVHGACPTGADKYAAEWARDHRTNGAHEERHPADWNAHGKTAGPRRNDHMARLGAGHCLAFILNKSAGATGCADAAERAGIPTTRHTATKPPWYRRPFACFDTETTAADPSVARLVTGDVLHLDPVTATISDHRSYLADPGIEIPAEAAAIHGITTERARADGIPVADAVLLLADDITQAWASGLPVVAFNASYDFTVLDHEMRRHHGVPFPVRGPVLDPYVIDKAMDRFRKGKRQLAAVCEHYGIELVNAHNSAADAEGAGRVMVALATKYQAKIKRRSLGDLWRSQRYWYRSQQTGLQAHFREQILAHPDRAYWHEHGHVDGCAAAEDKKAACGCGDAPSTWSAEDAAAAVYVDTNWPQRPYVPENEVAA
jgi:DNA polymerase-3 subunit epsilon